MLLTCQEEIYIHLKFPCYPEVWNYVLSADKIDQAKLKRELEEYGRKLYVMQHFI